MLAFTFLHACTGTAFAAVQTLAASGVTPGSAVLNGVVNPDGGETAAWFEWGTTNFAQQTPGLSLGSGSTNVSFSQIITGLTIQTTYYFRAVASNNSGVFHGVNQSFTTPVFTEVEAGLPAYDDGSAAWGDFDDDGRLDLLLTGFGGPSARVWRNTGSGFIPVWPDLTAIDVSSVAWSDYNNDGRLDFVLTGYSYDKDANLAEVWRNVGDGFANANAGVDGVFFGATGWADFDNDGKPDLVITGGRYGFLGGRVAGVWRNTGGRFMNLNLGLAGVWRSATAWGDFDNDGHQDLLLAGQTDSGTLSFDVWRNTGDGFTNLNAGLPPLNNCSVAWGDYDNDGRLDILFCGGSTSGPVAQVWRNNGSGFTNINAGLPGVDVQSGNVAWGDYDNDGRLDILLGGRVFRNTGDGFADINTGLPAPYYTAVAWGDYDDDGRLDIVFSGDAGFSNCHVFKNNTPRTNTPPMPPTNLAVLLNGTTGTFTWDSGNDAETPAAGLTYNIRVGTTPGGCDILSPMSGSDGKRRLPEMGNVQMARSHQLVNLPLNKTIYWSVQSVDTAFAGSVFAPEASFRVNGFLSPASGPVPGDLNGDGDVDATDLNVMLPAYWKENPLALEELKLCASNRIEVAVTNLTALGFSVRASTNLTDWDTIGPAELGYQFADTNENFAPFRFYRLRWP